jgi:tetratricopeptide (TPR) repeat protein
MQNNLGRHMGLPLALPAAFAAVFLFAEITLIEQGRAAINRGDSDAAIEILEKAVAQSPKSAEAHFTLGSAYGAKIQAGGMLAAAKYASSIKEEFEKAVALDPKHVDARFGLVQVYAGAPGIMGGSYEKALEQAKEIKAIDPIFGHRAYAFVYSQQKKLDLARREFADAIREEPKSPKAHSYFGQHLANVEKDYTAASAEFETALKLDPHYMPAFYHLGRAAAQASANLPRGEEALKQYVAYTPAENEPPPANAHYWLGAIYEKQGKKAEAKLSYQESLKLNPTLKQASEALRRVS